MSHEGDTECFVADVLGEDFCRDLKTISIGDGEVGKTEAGGRDILIGAIGPLNQQYVNPTIKSIPTSTIAAALFLFSGKLVVKLANTNSAKL